MNIDELLMIIENPTRRRILQALVKERFYPLQLSKELRLSQQAISKHLKLLEEFGYVKSTNEESDVSGPRRKCYIPIIDNHTIFIDIGKNIFQIRMKCQKRKEKVPDKNIEKLEMELEKLRIHNADDKRVAGYYKLLEEINDKIGELESRRTQLLQFKEQVVEQLKPLINRLFEERTERLIASYIIEDGLSDSFPLIEEYDIRERMHEEVYNKIQKIVQPYKIKNKMKHKK